MLTTLLFDIGGVLIRTETLEPRRKWERKFGLQDWQLADLFFASPIGEAAQIGQASTADAWAYVADTLAISTTQLAELKHDFWAGDVLDHELIALIQSLRPRYKTGIISNAMPDARENLKDQINDDTFDTIVFSGEEGIRKPIAEIYQRALARIDTKPHEAVFVDDMLPNVQAAREVGLHAIHYTMGMDVAEALRELGIKVTE